MNTPTHTRPAAERDALLQAALDFIKTLTSMEPPPIEVAPPEVFAPFRAFVDTVQKITSQHTPEDTDGETFRSAARLGLTLRFHGGCAQSSMPGTPSAYEVVTGGDRAASMREAVQRAAAVIAGGGEPQRLDATTAQAAPAAEQIGERPHIDANDLESIAMRRPNDTFLKGTGVLKLIRAIRDLERANSQLQAQVGIENLCKALRFYADKEHFAITDEGAWDTVSGEPQNYWCDAEGTAMVEDGSIARLALAGHAINFEDEDAETEHVADDVSALAAKGGAA